MDGLELISFNIISAVGTAKSMVMESMEKSRAGKFDESLDLIKQANEFLVTGEKEHFKVITQQAKDKNVEIDILFMHAEDQLMSTVTLRDMANELLEMNKMIYYLREKIGE